MSAKFLYESWYVIAWKEEIPDIGIFSRKVLGIPILIYKNSSKEYVALEDRCCHRLAPLSLGKLEKDGIRCGYHGLKFDDAGKCTDIPWGSDSKDNLSVRKFPIIERNRWVYVWMGKEENVDESLLPDNFSCDHPEWKYKPGYLKQPVPFGLLVDNLLDFSHLSYVHSATFGGTTKIAQTLPEIEEIPNGLRIRRFMSNSSSSGYYERAFGLTGRMDREITYDFILPSILIMSSKAFSATKDQQNKNLLLNLHGCQALTPETNETTHYFFQESHHIDFGNNDTADLIYDEIIKAFKEDMRIIEGQNLNIEQDATPKMRMLSVDIAAVKFQRLLNSRLPNS